MTNNQDRWERFLGEFVKLGLWYVDKRVRAGESEFEEAFNTRVNIYRYTSMYRRMEIHPAKGGEHPEWTGIVSGLKKIHHAC